MLNPSSPIEEEELTSENGSNVSEITFGEQDAHNSVSDVQQGSSLGETAESAAEPQDLADTQLHADLPVEEGNLENQTSNLRERQNDAEHRLVAKITMSMRQLRRLSDLNSLAIADITSVCDSALAQPTDGQFPGGVNLTLKDCLMAHGQKLFAEVACDPPKWLKYSIWLRSEPVFVEAMVHLVGCWPTWPWPTRNDAVPRDILRNIQKKSARLLQHCRTTNQALFLSTITVAKRKVKHEEEELEEFGPIKLTKDSDAWLVVAKWREWFSGRLRDIQDPLTLDPDPTQLGAIYRTIHARVDYLLPEDLMNEFGHVNVNFPHYAKEICEDLTLFKTSQAELVEDLIQNRLMLHVENHPEIKHLTCAKITEDDLPWKQSGTCGNSRKRTVSVPVERPFKRRRVA